MDSVDDIRAYALRRIRVDEGTPYPARQSHLDYHRAFKATGINTGPFLSKTEATNALVRHNRPGRKVPPNEQEAIDNMLDLIRDYEDGCDWSSDLAIKCFTDLDMIFFGGRLLGKVCVKWGNTDDHFMMRFSKTAAYGITEVSPIINWGRARTWLNIEWILCDEVPEGMTPFLLMFGVLLHELVHCYDAVVSPRLSCFFDEPHDKDFGTCLRSVHERATRILGIGAMIPGQEYEELSHEKIGKGQVLACGGRHVKKGRKSGKGGRRGGEKKWKRKERRDKRAGPKKSQGGCAVM